MVGLRPSRSWAERMQRARQATEGIGLWASRGEGQTIAACVLHDTGDDFLEDEDATSRARRWPIRGFLERRRARRALADKRWCASPDGPGWRARNGSWYGRKPAASCAAWSDFPLGHARNRGCGRPAPPSRCRGLSRRSECRGPSLVASIEQRRGVRSPRKPPCGGFRHYRARPPCL
jgi:hypothetical protein